MGAGNAGGPSTLQKRFDFLLGCRGNKRSDPTTLSSASPSTDLPDAHRTPARTAQCGVSCELISSPGELLERTAAREELSRQPGPCGARLRLCRPGFAGELCWVLWRLQPDVASSVLPKPVFWAAWHRGSPRAGTGLHAARAEAGDLQGIKRNILLAAERTSSRLAHVVLCNSESMRSEAVTLALSATKCSCWATAAATASTWNASRRIERHSNR